MSMTTTEERVNLSMLVISSITASLSIFGSSSILYLVLKTKKIQQLYHRLIFGLSFSDLLSSASYLLQINVSEGNRCNAAVFLNMFFLSSSIYNAELSLYYVLMIKHNVPEKLLKSRMEPTVHIVPILVALILGSVGLGVRIFGLDYYTGHCFITYSPDDYDCTTTACTIALIFIMLVMVVFIATAVIGVTCTWVVFWTVHRRYNRSAQRFATDHAMSDQQQKRIRSMTTQAICYTVAFVSIIVVTIISMSISIANSNRGNTNDASVLTVRILNSLLFPLQGFYNMFIYMRPRLMQWKNSYPEKSWCWAYSKVFTGQAPPVRPSAGYHETLAPTTVTVGGPRAGTSPVCCKNATTDTIAKVSEPSNKNDGNHEQEDAKS